MLKGNKGEWSELYVLVKLMADGKLFQSDINLNVDHENVYDVIKAYKGEYDYDLEFDRQNDVIIYKVKDGNKYQVSRKTIEEFKRITNVLFLGIKKGKGLSFQIPSAEPILNDIDVQRVKASAGTKADIKLRIYDHRLAKETDLGFSIKSLLGSNSTLFNTGPGNNFIFEVSDIDHIDLNDFNRSTYAPAGRISKLTHRINILEELGGKFEFSGIQSEQLWRNLKMIDGDLPSILGWSLYYRWLTSTSSLLEVTTLLEENDPLNFYNGKESQQKLYEYKIKKFLVESAMGMTSEKPWLGEYDSFGGVIIAKNDGDLVCFHIYDFNLFRNYLLNNTVFEQPSTGEDQDNPGNERLTGKKYYYGWLYKDVNKFKFKINLQVRFK